MENDSASTTRRHTWPWLLLGAVLTAILLAVLWVSAEVRRTQQRKQYYIPQSETNLTSPAR